MGLYLLIPTFIVILLSVLIVRAGAIALQLTGLDEKTANFQALSAFTRAGFTTRESELVVSHPQRRTIVTWLIILGNAGIVAVIVTGTSSLASTSDYRLAIDIAALIIGIYIIYRVFRHSGITRRWENLIESRFSKLGFFNKTGAEHLLRLPVGYGVARITLTAENFQSESAFKAKLAAINLSILGIERQGLWIASPGASEPIAEGDSLFLYGALNEMDRAL